MPVRLDQMAELRGGFVAGMRPGVETQMRGVGVQRCAFDGEALQNFGAVVAREQRPRAIARQPCKLGVDIGMHVHDEAT